MQKTKTGGIPPVIIIGMHRSGTNLVTRSLMQLGVNMGWLREGNSEAIFYQRKNESIFSLSGAAWDKPEPLEKALRDQAVAANFAAELARYSRSSKALFFWGLWRWAAMKSGLSGINTPWGWKDPRNTFTLSLWLALYPEAKVIHVVRNGVDVAVSLRKREQRRLRTRKNPHHSSLRCLNLSGGFSLWEEYVRRGLAHEQELAGRCLRIKYEDFLAEPVSHGERLVAFLNLQANISEIQKTVAMIDGSRGNAYQSDPELINFFGSVKSSPCMRALGYDR